MQIIRLICRSSENFGISLVSNRYRASECIKPDIAFFHLSCQSFVSCAEGARQTSLVSCAKEAGKTLSCPSKPRHSFTRFLCSAFAMNNIRVFEGQKDRFKGVTVDSLTEPCDDSVFEELLKASLERWKKNGTRGVWFKVALEHAGWVPHLARNGFRFHHAHPSYVTMVQWLPENEVCAIPQFAHTMIGVGAVVINEKRQILVVQEKYYNVPHWKLPGGYVEPGEDISSAAEREVMEETSIRAQFKMLVCFRHMHTAMFNCSDIYYIVALTPEPGQNVLKKCDREIAAVKWMNVDEYLHHSHVHSTNRFFVQKFLEYETNGISLSYHTDSHPLLKRPYKIYSLNLGPQHVKSIESGKAGSCDNKL